LRVYEKKCIIARVIRTVVMVFKEVAGILCTGGVGVASVLGVRELYRRYRALPPHVAPYRPPVPTGKNPFNTPEVKAHLSETDMELRRLEVLSSSLPVANGPR
jgi:hypothetical protein